MGTLMLKLLIANVPVAMLKNPINAVHTSLLEAKVNNFYRL